MAETSEKTFVEELRSDDSNTPKAMPYATGYGADEPTVNMPLIDEQLPKSDKPKVVVDGLVKSFGDLAVLRVLLIAEYRTKHQGIPPLH